MKVSNLNLTKFFKETQKKSIKMIMKCLLLTLLAFASDENKNVFGGKEQSEDLNESEQIFVKIEEDDYVKKTSNYQFVGVSYTKRDATWTAYRWSKNEKKIVHNGSNYKDEETAAHASDTLARKLIANGEKGHKLNFPHDDTEVYPTEKTSQYIGVSYNKRDERWRAHRQSKKESKMVCNGSYKDEETAAHASDTLARKLIENGEKGHKLNFPDDDTEVWAETNNPNYFGVAYSTRDERWSAQRWSKNEHKSFYNGANYKDEETAAHASDTLARKLIANGESHKLNFPDDGTEVYPEVLHKKFDYIGVQYIKKQATWRARRWSKYEGKTVCNGYHKHEETAAHASDTLARKLIANGEKGHKLNFPDDTEVWAEEGTYQQKKRKRPTNLEHFQKNKKSYQNSI